MQRLLNKIAILTGGATSMGEAHARRLVVEGAQVVITGLNSEAGVALAAELGENAIFVAQNVSREADWENVVSTALDRFGGIDILVNNAGIHSFGSFVEESVEKLRKILDVNVAGSWLSIQKVAPHMRA